MLLLTRAGPGTVGAPAATARPTGREAPHPVVAAAVAMTAPKTLATMTVPEARAGTNRDYTQSCTLQGPELRRRL